MVRYNITAWTRAQYEEWLQQMRQPPMYFGRYAPSQEAIGQRTRELQGLGLRDESEFPGISSPVHHYAANTLIRELALQAGDPGSAPDTFRTDHPGLLAAADQLSEHYGVCPISFEGYRAPV